MAIGLKPCPFCGNKPYFKKISTAYSDSSKATEFKIHCDTCGYDYGKLYKFQIEFDLERDGGVKVVSDGRLAAAVEWNRRADDEQSADNRA